MLAERKASQNRHCRGTARVDQRPGMNFCFFVIPGADLAGTETTGALGLLLLADSNNVDLEVVEL
jgi:hypothetical protein